MSSLEIINLSASINGTEILKVSVLRFPKGKFTQLWAPTVPVKAHWLK